MTQHRSMTGHLAIKASAGTGKTHCLTRRFITLLSRGAPAESVLATTFTRKAAGEMLDRVLADLSAAATDADSCAEMAKQIGDGGFSMDRAAELLQGLLRELHRLNVCTLDSFFAQLAGGFSLELGLPVDWRIVDEATNARLKEQAVQAMLNENDTGALVPLVRLMTRGKVQRSVTGQLLERMTELHDLYRQSPPAAWTAIPRPGGLLDDAARRAALDRLAAIELPTTQSGQPDSNWFKTHDKAIEAAWAGDWVTFITTGIAARVVTGAPTFYRKPIAAAVSRGYQPLVDHAKAVLIHQAAEEIEATGNLLALYDRQYERIRREQRAAHFNDVTARLGAGSITGRLDEMYYRLDARIRHLLLDEFQDTSHEQWKVIGPVAAEIGAYSDGEHTLFVVGDEKQAIYGWRGGVAEIFDTLDTQLHGLNWQELNKSWRSAQPIIDVVNRVFRNLATNPALRNEASDTAVEWAERCPEHTTVHEKRRGYVKLEVANAAEDATDSADDQATLTLRRAVEVIRQLHRQTPNRNIGVLVRTNEAIGQLIHMLGEGDDPIEASEEGGVRLTTSPAVALIESMLTLADHPGDTVCRFHIAHSPLGEAVGLTDFTADSTAERVAFEARADLVRDGYGPTLYKWAAAIAPLCGERDMDRLMQLIELAHGYEASATLRPSDFVRVIEAAKVEDPSAAPVRVMTIHKAKGLQFDIVVLPELDERLTRNKGTVLVERDAPTEPPRCVWPFGDDGVRALEPRWQAAYERQKRREVRDGLNLLYVAMTRARYAVHMVIAPSKDNEKSIPATFAGMLRGALTDGQQAEAQAVLYEHGDSCWFEREPRRDEGSAAAAAPVLPREVALAPIQGGRTRLLPRRSPSDAAEDVHVDLKRELLLVGERARREGELLHALFERIGWLDEASPGDESLRSALTAKGAAAEEADDLLRRFRGMLDAPAVRLALSRNAYPWSRIDVRCEYGFVERLDEAIVAGRCDRLVIGRDESGRVIGADIIDVKTDAVDAAQASSHAQRYAGQMSLYRRAMAKRLHIDEAAVTTRLLFVQPGVICEPH